MDLINSANCSRIKVKSLSLKERQDEYIISSALMSNFHQLVPLNFLNTVPANFHDRVPLDFLRVVPRHGRIPSGLIARVLTMSEH